MEDLLGVREKTWSNYENGVSEPGIEGLIQISNFFGVTLDALIVEDLNDDGKHMPKKPKPYLKVAKSSKVKESGFEYLLKKVERIEKDLDSMRKSKSGKKSD
jgi:transcriptional regulator with XRE-family HTH domain